MKKQFLYIGLVAAILAGLASPVARGQTNAQVTVLRTTAKSGDDGVAVSVLFTVLDSTGQAIPKEAIRFEGEGQAYGPSFANVAASVGEAKTPIKIALVIDASGSMAQEMKDVRQAAINFVGKVPEGAEIAIFKFSDEVEQVQGFTPRAQLGPVENAILSITNRQPGTGNTCIYKAAYEAIKGANTGIDQNSVARPAVVLFTDGKDSEAGPTCGEIKEQQVVTQALQSNPVIPTQVHTIGLCVEANCANVNSDALRTLAEKTHGATKVGNLGELDTLFGTILSALNNQWMATANVKPGATGKHRITFDFNASINNGPTPIALTTEFESERNYALPPTQVAVADRTFDAAKNEYTLTLKVTNPQQIKQLTVVLRDAKRDRVWKDSPQNVSETMEITVPAEGLKEKTEFTIEVEAIDANGAELRNENGEWPSSKGTYEPQEQAKLDFEFATFPEFSWDKGAFTIRLTGLDGRKDTKLLYKGSINAENAPFMEIPEGVLNGNGEIVVALPADKLNKLRQDLSSATQGKPYTIDLTLSDPVAGHTIRKDKPTTVTPPPVMTFWQRIQLALGNYIVLGSIAAIVVVVGGVLIAMSMRNRKPAVPTPLYNEQTQMGVAQRPRKEANPRKETNPRKEVLPTPPVGDKTEIGDGVLEPELRIKVLATPEPSLNRGGVINRFPCVIGRENSSFLIAGDPKVSRQHAEIVVQGKQIIIKDLRSGNGTAFVIRDPKNPSGEFIEKKRIEKGGSAEWDHQSILRLGPNTFLELKPQGSLQPSSPQTAMHDKYDNRTEILG